MPDWLSSPLIVLLPTAFFTLALYSFLYNDNPFFKFAEHVFAGLSAGYYVGLIFQSVIVQQLYVPLTQDGRYLLIFPGALGLLLFARFFPRIGWLTRIPLAFVIGSTAGITFIQQLHGLILPQVASTILPLTSINNVLIVVGVLSTLIYFFFSKPHTGPLGWVASGGIGFIMVAFGAHFGYTVMARVSLLIGRIQFLLVDWLHIAS
ncbi:MAG TPA: hypothetical protein VM118_09205 [Acidobacteriota bacterium]|nr:hypothetical protein [Acidobacteriota bacterium]